MEIKSISLSRLKNEEHFKFQSDFKELIEMSTPQKLKIESLFYNSFLPRYVEEQEALNIVQKNVMTDALVASDELRDKTFSGISGLIRSLNNHFDEEMKAAATRIQVVFDAYGNLATKPYDIETASINALVRQLKQSNMADVEKLGLTDWIAELEKQNNEFIAIEKERFTQNSGKTTLRMKVVRMTVDIQYKTIVKRINALIEINGNIDYIGFVKELNLRIDHYNNLVAQRDGRVRAKNEMLNNSESAN